MFLGKLNDLVKRPRVVDGEFGQRLPIQLDARFLQAMDQLTVTQAARPAGGVDADDPQPAELPLADAAIAESIHAATDQRDDRLAVKIVPTGTEALGALASAGASLAE